MLRAMKASIGCIFVQWDHAVFVFALLRDIAVKLNGSNKSRSPWAKLLMRVEREIGLALRLFIIYYERLKGITL